MTEQVWIALIGSFQVVTVTAIGVIGTILVKRLGGIRTDVGEVKHEVKNDHKVNLRDDLDNKERRQKHRDDQVLDVLGWLSQGWVENRADITDINQDTGRGQTRRARRLAAARPPVIQYSDMPGGTE